MAILPWGYRRCFNMTTDTDAAAHAAQIRHRTAPVYWQYGFSLGNGRLSAMCWGDRAPLAFTLDHADLWYLHTQHGYREHPDYSYAELRRLVAAGRFDEVIEVFERH